MGKMGSSLFHRPVLHGVGHHSCNAGIQMLAKLHGFFQSLIGLLWQTLLHHMIIENHAAKQFRDSPRLCCFREYCGVHGIALLSLSLSRISFPA